MKSKSVPAVHKYAEGTTVKTETSLQEIHQTLKRYGATSTFQGETNDKVWIAFTMQFRQVRFSLLVPQENDFTRDSRGYLRSDTNRYNAYQQAKRQRYRALLLVIKAKLESIESGIETFDQAFMANILLADNRTVGEAIENQISDVYLTGKMPPLLSSGK